MTKSNFGSLLILYFQKSRLFLHVSQQLAKCWEQSSYSNISSLSSLLGKAVIGTFTYTTSFQPSEKPTAECCYLNSVNSDEQRTQRKVVYFSGEKFFLKKKKKKKSSFSTFYYSKENDDPKQCT